MITDWELSLSILHFTLYSAISLFAHPHNSLQTPALRCTERPGKSYTVSTYWRLMFQIAPIMTSSENRDTNTSIDPLAVATDVSPAFQRLEALRAKATESRNGNHQGSMLSTQGKGFSVDAQLGLGHGIRIEWQVSSNEYVLVSPPSSRPNDSNATCSPPSTPVTAQTNSLQPSIPAARDTQDSFSGDATFTKSPTTTLDSYHVPGAYPQSGGEDATG